MVALVAHTVIPHSRTLLEFPFALQTGDQKLANPFPQGPKNSLVKECYISKFQNQVFHTTEVTQLKQISNQELLYIRQRNVD